MIKVIYVDGNQFLNQNNADQELEHLASLTNSLTTAEVFLFSCSAITDTLLRDKGIVTILKNIDHDI